ncbi:MAG: hypothetical protein V4697_02295 [Patescibacteria group bacterium]
MLTPVLKSQFVTRIITNASGEQFKVVFLVTLVNGKPEAQIVSATSLSQKVYALPKPVVKTKAVYTYQPSFSSIISPLNSLFFFNSQPTRAPSFR